MKRFRFVPLVLALLLSSGFRSGADTIAFFYALEKDFETLKAESQPSGQAIKVGSRSIACLQLASHRVYAVKMGSGAVETAASAQALLARVRCDAAISLGPVGALSDKLDIGSWHRVGEVAAYQKGSWTKNGFQLSPALPANGTNEFTGRLVAPKLFAKVEDIKVASGEIFIASEAYRAQLRDTTGADAVEMNLSGLLPVCADHHVPVVNWRIVSDKANDNASEDFRKFVTSYDGAGGKAVAELIKNLPANPNSPDSYPNLKKALSGSTQ